MLPLNLIYLKAQSFASHLTIHLIATMNFKFQVKQNHTKLNLQIQQI